MSTVAATWRDRVGIFLYLRICFSSCEMSRLLLNDEARRENMSRVQGRAVTHSPINFRTKHRSQCSILLIGVFAGGIRFNSRMRWVDISLEVSSAVRNGWRLYPYPYPKSEAVPRTYPCRPPPTTPRSWSPLSDPDAPELSLQNPRDQRAQLPLSYTLFLRHYATRYSIKIEGILPRKLGIPGGVPGGIRGLFAR